jgi:RNA polymerase sigma factor (sigma-70 family)
MDWQNVFMRMQAGDKTAHELLYEHYGKRGDAEGLLSRYIRAHFIRARVSSEALQARLESDLEEIVQEALRVTIQEIETVSLRSPFAIGRFVHIVAYRIFRRYWRRYRNDPTVPPAVPLPDDDQSLSPLELWSLPTQEAQAIRDEEGRLFAQALQQIAPDDQRLIALRVFDEFAFAEIATVLGKDEPSVRARYYYVLEKLSAIIQDLLRR